MRVGLSWDLDHAQGASESWSAVLAEIEQADSLGYEGRFKALETAIAKAYDLSFMGQKVVGRHWKDFTDDEKQQWLSRFENLTVANYAGRFVGHAGESFETLGESEAAHDTMMVQTLLHISEDKAIEFNYRLRKVGDDWRIIDVYMNGTVSELALRRSDFSATLKRDGFESLVASIDQKIADLEAENTLAAKVGE